MSVGSMDCGRAWNKGFNRSAYMCKIKIKMKMRGSIIFFHYKLCIFKFFKESINECKVILRTGDLDWVY